MKNKRTFKAIVSMITIIAIMISFLAIYVPTSVAKSSVKSKSVSLNINSVTISVGDIVVLNAKMKPTNSTDSLSWSSSAKSIAGVSKTGVVTGKKEGTAKITVKTASKKIAVCTVKVKAYLTKKEILKLIQSNILSEESIQSMISKNTLSKNDIINLIQENALSEETVKKIVKEQSFTEEEIISFVKKNSLSEETVKKWIAEAVNGNSFEDGEELQPVPGQQLPYNGYGVVINKITVKKYHCNWWENNGLNLPQKIRYEITAEGKISHQNYFFDNFGFTLTFPGDYFDRSYGFNMKNESTIAGKKDGNIENVSFTIDAEGNFVYKVNQYNIMQNLNYFYISEAYCSNDW